MVATQAGSARVWDGAHERTARGSAEAGRCARGCRRDRRVRCLLLVHLGDGECAPAVAHGRLITVGAISVMVLWLLFTNRLWERRGKDGSLTEAAMYNVSTLATLLVAVAVLYAALFAGILVAALVVIESGFMEQTIGTSVSLMNYVDIAWLSASMGTVAGALGSNFDSTADVRSLTHGSRYAQRFQAQDNEEQSEWAYGAATSPTSAAGESSGSAEK